MSTDPVASELSGEPTPALMTLDELTRRAIEAMLEGIRTNEIIVGAYSDRDGGVCPMLAAHRNGLTEVILPKRNEADLEDVPEAVREAMTFHIASTYADVLKAAFA